MKDDCDCMKKLKHRWTLIPAFLMVGFGLMQGNAGWTLGGLVAAAIIYELQELNKCCKNSIWY